MIGKTVGSERGLALMAALSFLAVLGLIAAAAVLTTSSETKIAGNARKSAVAGDIARTAITEAKGRLVGSSVPTPPYPYDYPFHAGDTNDPPSPNWTAYITTNSTNFNPSNDDPDDAVQGDPEYSSSNANRFPTEDNPTNTSRTENSTVADSLEGVYPDLAPEVVWYWARIRHQTESDLPAGTVYTDNGGTADDVVYWGYPDSNRGGYELFTTDANPPFARPVEIVTAYGYFRNSRQIAEVVLRQDSGPPILAAIFCKGDLSGSADSLSVTGDPNNPDFPVEQIYLCIDPSLDPAVVAADPNHPSYPSITGSSGEDIEVVLGPRSIDVAAGIDRLKAFATESVNSLMYGQYFIPRWPPEPEVYHYEETNPSADVYVIGTGYGILLVEGGLTMWYSHWYGIVLASGDVTLNNADIDGVLITDGEVRIIGDVDVVYNSQQVASALRQLPLNIITQRYVQY